MTHNPTTTEKTGTISSTALENTIADILVASLSELAKAGEVEAACRFAGQAYVVLKGSDLAAARRFDVLLHRLTPNLKW